MMLNQQAVVEPLATHLASSSAGSQGSGCLYIFFLKWGSPSLCIEEMHMIFFYLIYSTKTGKKPDNNHTS
jgi:hypothetical protein